LYGISGIANRLIKSYLLSTYQRVIINDNNLNKISSRWAEVKYGVPQGSILGLLLFLLYINDFPKTISGMSNPTLFADDTSIIIANPTPTELKKYINQLFIETNKWFQSNVLYLNYEKTHFMQFLTRKNKANDIQVPFGNKHITNISKTKFRGLTIDTSMSWEEHIKELTSKLNKACNGKRI
jgi:hypothetical protein